MFFEIFGKMAQIANNTDTIFAFVFDLEVIAKYYKVVYRQNSFQLPRFVRQNLEVIRIILQWSFTSTVYRTRAVKARFDSMSDPSVCSL